MTDSEFRRRLVRAIEAFVMVEKEDLARRTRDTAEQRAQFEKVWKEARKFLRPAQPPKPYRMRPLPKVLGGL